MTHGSGLGRFLTLAEVAQILNASVSHVYVLVRSGELPAIRLGDRGHWRVERGVLESFIEAKYEQTRLLNRWNESERVAEDPFASDNPPTIRPVPRD